jgi:hypothetical protein
VDNGWEGFRARGPAATPPTTNQWSRDGRFQPMINDSFMRQRSNMLQRQQRNTGILGRTAMAGAAAVNARGGTTPVVSSPLRQQAADGGPDAPERAGPSSGRPAWSEQGGEGGELEESAQGANQDPAATVDGTQ